MLILDHTAPSFKDVSLTGGDFKLPFDVNVFSKILNANKDMESGKIKLSKIGVIQITFNSNDMYSEYYMTRKETIN